MDLPNDEMNWAYEGPEAGLRPFLAGLAEGSFYTYALLKPTGEPFYIGKGTGLRVLQHRLEALRGGLAPRSNPFKCNVIRRIETSGKALLYRIDRVFPAAEQLACLQREELLIAHYRRRCDGGTLTNLSAGLGSPAGRDPLSRRRHATTLSGVSAERPERTALNIFLRGLCEVNSIPVKPLSEYRDRLVPGYASPKALRSASPRNALTLVASALACGLMLEPGVEIPRAFDYIPDLEDWPFEAPPPPVVSAVIENGALSDILKLDLAELVPAARPEDERLRLSDAQIATVSALLGPERLQTWGLLPG